MKTRGWCVLTAVAIVAGAMVTTGCDKFDRFRSVEWRKHKYMESGKKYMSQKKYGEAKIQFMRAVAVDSKWSEAQFELGMAATGAREFPRAFRAFQNAVSADPKNIKALQEIA